MSNEAPLLAPIVRDYHNRPLEVGDEILLNVKGPIFFRVTSIRPNLDPNLPKNLMFVDVACGISYTAQREARNMEFILVRAKEEAPPMPFRPMTEQEKAKL